MASFAKKQHQPPETVTGDVGSAKRNIIRKGGGSAHNRKANLAGHLIDDGSLYNDPSAIDEHDPNYDSENEPDYVKQNIPTSSGLHREEIAKSRLTLTQYKRQVEPIIREYFVSGDLDEVAKSLQVIILYYRIKTQLNAFIRK
jgi:hypothetical protein